MQRPFNTANLVATVLAIALQAHAEAVREWEVEGRLHCLFSSPDGEETRQREYAYTAWAKGNCWGVQVAPSPRESKVSRFISLEISSDGTSTYILSVFNPDHDNTASRKATIRLVERMIRTVPSEEMRAKYIVTKRQLETSLEKEQSEPRQLERSSNQAVAKIQPFPYPEYDSADVAAVVWLAYCSHGYLRDQEDIRLPLLWPLRAAAPPTNTGMFRAHVTRMESFPHLPRSALFLHSGTNLLFTESGAVACRALPPPFDKGYTNAAFEVHGVTNCGGITLPHAFTLSSYFPRTLDSLGIWARFQGISTQVRLSCQRTNIPPTLPVPTLIQDCRLADRPQYLSRPGPWPVTTNQAVLHEYEHEILSTIAVKQNRRRLLVSTVLGIVILSGFVLAFRRGKSKETRNIQSTRKS